MNSFLTCEFWTFDILQFDEKNKGMTQKCLTSDLFFNILAITLISFRLSLRKGLCLSLDPFVRNNKQLFNTNWNIEIKKDCLQQSKFKFPLKFKTQNTKFHVWLWVTTDETARPRVRQGNWNVWQCLFFLKRGVVPWGPSRACVQFKNTLLAQLGLRVLTSAL